VRDAIGDAVDANDLDGLLRLVDACCDARDWDALVSLRDRSRRAIERGRQLWPAASHAEYRLALDAPAQYAALVLTDDAGRFAIGPLPEVAASTHTWAELAPHVRPVAAAAIAAHERVVRGERIDARTVSHADVLGVPLALAPWEPDYLLPVYRRDRVDEPGPEPMRGRPVALPARAPETVRDHAVEQALRDLVRPWTAQSEGSARVVAVRGGIEEAIAALGARDVRGAWVDAAAALALFGWAGSSGGRHGRRRGAAAGRDLAWATAGALTGFEPGVQPDPVALGDAMQELRWFVWHAPDASSGWVLRIAVANPAGGVAWACDATDRGAR
jgi:hypothetical protein